MTLVVNKPELADGSDGGDAREVMPLPAFHGQSETSV